jgi:hypothetical protein
MKDSRIGSYGAAALVLTLPGRAALWPRCARKARRMPLAFVLAHAGGRDGGPADGGLPYAGDAEHAKASRWPPRWGGRVERGTGLAALVGAGAAWAGGTGARTVVRRWPRLGWCCGRCGAGCRRLGGYTGDTLGAAGSSLSWRCCWCWPPTSPGDRLRVAPSESPGAAGAPHRRARTPVDRAAPSDWPGVSSARRVHGLPRIVVTSPARRCVMVGRRLRRWGWVLRTNRHG